MAHLKILPVSCEDWRYCLLKLRPLQPNRLKKKIFFHAQPKKLRVLLGIHYYDFKPGETASQIVLRKLLQEEEKEPVYIGVFNSTTNWHLPRIHFLSTSQGLSHTCCCSCWPFNICWRGAQEGDQKEAFGSEKLAEWPSNSYIFSGTDSVSSVVTFSCLEKHHISSWWCLLPNHYMLTFPLTPLGAVSQSYSKCCLPDYSPHFAPDKI